MEMRSDFILRLLPPRLRHLQAPSERLDNPHGSQPGSNGTSQLRKWLKQNYPEFLRAGLEGRCSIQLSYERVRSYVAIVIDDELVVNDEGTGRLPMG